MKESSNLPNHKEFGLSTLSVNNRTTVAVLTAIIVFLGLTFYNNMPKESFPEVKMPTVYIGTVYPGNSPKDMENLVTRPLEKELNTITNVSKITSTSVQDYSTIIVEFNSDVPVEEALRKTKDAVDKGKKELPSDLDEEPNVFELNFSEFPVMNINLSGDFSIERLKEYAEYLEDEIEKLSEISKVEIRGLDDKEVKINVDIHKMESLEVTFGDIEQAIRNENITMSGGNILTNGIRRSIRVAGEFVDPMDLGNVIIKDEKQNTVYLKDIATIDFTYEEKENYARLNAEQVVMLDVVKRSGGNLIAASEKIDEILYKARTEVFPSGLKISKTLDQSEKTIDQVNNLENNIISGVILVVLVLLFFLGTRNAMFVGIAIPMSMFLSFMILGFLGITINMMVLFGLIMALGMLVDNGIVVVENVVRLREEGYSMYDATKYGVGEVAIPIISSTATTLAAFLPLAFWPGMMGSFMLYLPVTLIVSLSSSLFVALVINPVFLSKYVKIEKTELNKKRSLIVSAIFAGVGLVFLFIGTSGEGLNTIMVSIGNLGLCIALLTLLNDFVFSPWADKFQNTVLPKLENNYARFLIFALKGRNSIKFFLGTVVLFFVSLILYFAFQPQVLFFPETDPEYVNVMIEYPIGTDVEQTNATTSLVEKKVIEILKPYNHIVEAVVTNVGEGAADPNDMNAIGAGSEPHKGRVTVNFLKYKLRDGISSNTVMEKIRNGLDAYPGVSITVAQNQNGPPVGKPVNIEISGPDYDQLITLSEKVKYIISDANIQGIEELKSNLETGKPELLVEIDREKARRFGVSTSQIAGNIRTSLFGKEVSKYKLEEDDYPIQLRFSEDYRYNIDALLNQRITFRDAATGKIKSIPISALATVKYGSTYGSIKRKDLDRVITLSSNVLDGYNPTEINDQAKDVINDLDVPVGYEVKFTGEQEKQAEEMAFLSQALLMAVFLIFLILVAQFNKVSSPIIILVSVLLSTIGVFLGLMIFQMPFIVIMTMIGIISLAGIVVNNAIVLIDFIELIKSRKESEGEELTIQELIDTIVMAGKTRLRPVLLTAITTVLGLIPLAVGLNIDFIGLISKFDPDFYLGGDNVAFWGPMSWTIIFGLTFATFLTLVIVPVMYLILEKFRFRGKKNTDTISAKKSVNIKVQS